MVRLHQCSAKWKQMWRGGREAVVINGRVDWRHVTSGAPRVLLSLLAPAQSCDSHCATRSMFVRLALRRRNDANFISSRHVSRLARNDCSFDEARIKYS